MAADPVVSPADTLRQALTAYLPDGFRDEDGVWHDGPVLQDALAALAALLAVGERDKARADSLAELVEQLDAARERDRRQIARLREVLSQLRSAVISENFSRPARSPAMSSNLRGALDSAALAVRETRPTGAVLAGEKDARP